MKTKLLLFVTVTIIGLISSTQAAEPKPLIDKALLKKSLLINSDFEDGVKGWQIWGYNSSGRDQFGGPIDQGVGDIKSVSTNGDLLGGGGMCLIPKSPGYVGITTKKTYDFKVREVYHMVVTLKGKYSSVWDVLGRHHQMYLALDHHVAGVGGIDTEYSILEWSAKNDGKWTRIDKIVEIRRNFTGRPTLYFFKGDMEVDNFILIKRN